VVEGAVIHKAGGSAPFLAHQALYEKAWALLEDSGSLDEYRGLTWDHFLWSLSFLKSYKMETEQAALFGVDKKTYHKWVWLCIKLISLLDVVS
jgi:hypothetical protein